MNRFFRQLPLSVKLILIGLVPFIFLIYLTYQWYDERAGTLKLLSAYMDRVNQSADVLRLIDDLQKERRLSFVYAMKKAQPAALHVQRTLTDSTIRLLQKRNDVGLKDFTSYTFLSDIPSIRNLVDSTSDLNPDIVMTYYTNAIFRLSTLNPIPVETGEHLQPVYKDLAALKLLSQMVTFLGIIRANIYNALYSGQNGVGTLYGMVGIWQIYETYETEYQVKASPLAIAQYQDIQNNSMMNPVVGYLNERFKNFSFDSTYNSEQWWEISGKAMDAMQSLQENLRNGLYAQLNASYNKERAHRNRTFVLLILALIIVVGIIIYTIHSITQMLKDLKIRARALARGVTGLKPGIFSDDVIGILAQSITEIDENNRYLANAANTIGNGNFNVSIQPRSKEDMLGNAIVQMKNNLQNFTNENEESKVRFQQLAQKYQTIFYKAPLPKWIYDIQTLKILEVNEAAIQHYGYSMDEFLNMTIEDLRPESDKEKFRSHINKVRAGTDARKGVWRHTKKNGEIATVEVTAHPILYNEEDARLVVINDITERLRSEKALRQQEETNRLIMSSSLDAIVCMDIHGKITFWNPQAEKIFGWKPGEVENRLLSDTIIPERYRERHKKGLELFIKTGKGVVLNRIIEITAMNKSGKEFPVELAIVSIQQDTTTFFCGFVRDISERKKAEEQLSGERNLLRALIDNLPDYIYVKDSEFNYIINNRSFVKLVGAASEAEIIGKNVKDLFGDDVGKINMDEDKNVLMKGNEIIDRDEPIITYEGEKRWLLTTKVPLKDKDGKVVGILGISKDISERKIAEEELMQSREDLRLLAAHLEQVREDERISIAREIHDELGQQLTVLKMDVSWLNKKLDGADKSVKEKAKGLLQMLDNTVKTVRKISSELRPSMLDDLGLLAAMDWHSQEFEKRSGIKTRFSSEMSNLDVTQTVGTGLFRIFQESLTNVARHAEATNVKASLEMKNGKLFMRIKDNGKGFTITSIENKKTLGILGMRERTLMMGGEYKIQSTPGKGTLVEVIVPIDSSN